MLRAIYKILLSIGLIVVLLSACTSLLGSSQPGEGVTIQMGQATWDSGWFQAQVFKVLLEELGYEVRGPETLDNIAYYMFSAQGDVDFWANGWFPIHNRYVENLDVAGKVETVGNLVKEGALQGYMIDKKTAEEFGITNLGDLKNPEIAEIFDQDGDGKADLIGCNEEWGCETVIDHHLEVYDLNDTVSNVKSDYNELMDETIARYKSGAPILFYTWTPNWTVFELKVGEDVMWLSVPFSSVPDDIYAMTELESMTGCLEIPCNLGYPFSDIRVVANVNFLANNPAAAKLFELVEIPLDEIAAQNGKMRSGEDSADDIRRHAEEWVEMNRSQIDNWLDEARAADK
jgi:glycine betaine/proline transport system substrate-binding protein